MSVWSERELVLLKRKLQALNYSNPVDAHSADLVQNLVNDLVHTTESYRGLKQQCDRQHTEISSFQSKVCSSPAPSSGATREELLSCHQDTMS